jgi:2-C-methyl-D-erythritol 4-phosphate cytidylyltransferase
MKASAIIVAAGSGIRLGFDVPKAFVELYGRSMLSYSLRTIAAVPIIEEAVVSIPPGRESQARADVRAAGLEIPVKLTPGGVERQDSVRIALALSSAEAELVVVHDAARPFATPAMFEVALATAARVGGAIAAIALADTLKRIGDHRGAGDHRSAGDPLSVSGTSSFNDPRSVGEHRAIVATIARTSLWQAQTPQAFRRELLIRAHERAVIDRVIATDDADLVEQLGATVAVVDGSAFNFKITTAEDLRLAELGAAALLKRSDEFHPDISKALFRRLQPARKILASRDLEIQNFRGGENPMPDEREILLQEIAILRHEIADVRGTLESLDQLVRVLNVTLLQCVDQVTTLTQKMLSPPN